MKFLDECKIHVRSGDGGAGSISFRREKNVPKGGPDGGDGGKGGAIWAEAVAGLNTLIDFRYRQHFKAGTGGHGQGKGRSGANAGDIILHVPLGVQIFDIDAESLIADLDRIGKRVLLADGGSGGWGNQRFKSSVNRAPRRANPGLKGQERQIRLRLKLIADAGLVGLPNAGKSTFLASISAARPQIADYPFTTLFPILGVARIAPGTEMIVADIPGLIDKASSGAGLGTRFLGHIERCPVLLHLVDAAGDDPIHAWRTVRTELAAYGYDLEYKPEILALSKTDACDPNRLSALTRNLEEETGQKVMHLSSHSRAGITDILAALHRARGTSKNEQEQTPGWTPE